MYLEFNQRFGRGGVGVGLCHDSSRSQCWINSVHFYTCTRIYKLDKWNECKQHPSCQSWLFIYNVVKHAMNCFHCSGSYMTSQCISSWKLFTLVVAQRSHFWPHSSGRRSMHVMVVSWNILFTQTLVCRQVLSSVYAKVVMKTPLRKCQAGCIPAFV